MATYTVKVEGQCSGGEHIRLAVLRNGVEVKKFGVTRTDMLTNNTDWEDALVFFLRQAIKKAGATTVSAAKTAVEAASWEF